MRYPENVRQRASVLLLSQGGEYDVPGEAFREALANAV